jgi:hypothetical protein
MNQAALPEAILTLAVFIQVLNVVVMYACAVNANRARGRRG